MKYHIEVILLLILCIWQAGCNNETGLTRQDVNRQDVRASAVVIAPQASNVSYQDKRSGEDHFGEANNLADGRKANEALKEYDLAIARGYDTAELRYEMGSVLASQLNRYEEAVEQFHIAVQRDEKYWRAHWALARALLEIKQYNEALSELDIAKRLDPSAEGLPIYAYYNAKALEGINRYHEALQNYETYLQYEDKIAPNSKEAHEVRERIKTVKEKMNIHQ
ncbi:MAG: tetratricopeptide repeat protein [Pyrinomonadaceae bacterium]